MSTDLVPQPHGGAIQRGREPGYSNPTAGRPNGLTPEIHQLIVEDIEAGNYAQVAAATAGISEATFYSWLKKGEEGLAPYRELLEAVISASGTAEKDATTAVKSRFGEDWKSAAWWLERRFPKRWGRQQRIEISTAPDNDMGWE